MEIIKFLLTANGNSSVHRLGRTRPFLFNDRQSGRWTSLDRQTWPVDRGRDELSLGLTKYIYRLASVPTCCLACRFNLIWSVLRIEGAWSIYQLGTQAVAHGAGSYWTSFRRQSRDQSWSWTIATRITDTTSALATYSAGASARGRPMAMAQHVHVVLVSQASPSNHWLEGVACKTIPPAHMYVKDVAGAKLWM